MEIASLFLLFQNMWLFNVYTASNLIKIINETRFIKTTTCIRKIGLYDHDVWNRNKIDRMMTSEIVEE